MASPQLGVEVPDEVALRSMEEIYRATGITWPPRLMADFVRHHMENAQFRKIILTAQDELPPDQWAHLHRANLAVARILARHLVADHPGPERSLRLMEGGVGGANSTHQVIKAIEDEASRTNRRLGSISYKGYELNDSFAFSAEAILRGQPIPPATLQARENATDERVKFFKRLGRRFHPLYENTFVDPVNMTDGIARAYGRRTHGTLDAFFCCYAFHHVPNGRIIGEHLGFGSDLVGCPFLAGTGDSQERFRSELITGLERKLGLPDGSEIRSGPVQVVLALLQNAPEAARREAVAQLRKFQPSNPGTWNPEWVRYLEDQQSMMLNMLRQLLRPGGLVAIADPDGFSKFNRRLLGGTTEMAVANFLRRRELIRLLQKSGFEILGRPTNTIEVVGETGPLRFEQRPEGVDDLGGTPEKYVADSNLGYIVVARRPYVGGRVH